jgi:hypothetical protein
MNNNFLIWPVIKKSVWPPLLHKLLPSCSGVIALNSVSAELFVLEDEPLEDADTSRHAVVLDESVTFVFTRNLKKVVKTII